MFIDNKYTKWYFNIIKQADHRDYKEYVEKHHIIPSCLGGSNKKDNIVTLLPREHYICHLLLTKMTKGQARYKMAFALSMLVKVKSIGEGRHIVTGRLYEYARRVYKEALDDYWTIDKRAERSKKYKELNIKPKAWTEETIERVKATKIWTEKAKENRLTNCLTSAAKRKGVKNPDHGKRIFYNYVLANRDLIPLIWDLYDKGLNRRQISLQLNISWDRVNLAINNKVNILSILEKQNS